jgi:hypothetical protein
MRMYQPIWERLKQKDRVVLVVEPFMVKRVKKAVIREKDSDTAFKLANKHLQDRFILRFEYLPEQKHLIVVLKQSIGLEDKVITLSEEVL